MRTKKSSTHISRCCHLPGIAWVFYRPLSPNKRLTYWQSERGNGSITNMSDKFYLTLTSPSLRWPLLLTSSQTPCLWDHRAVWCSCWLEAFSPLPFGWAAHCTGLLIDHGTDRRTSISGTIWSRQLVGLGPPALYISQFVHPGFLSFSLLPPPVATPDELYSHPVMNFCTHWLLAALAEVDAKQETRDRGVRAGTSSWRILQQKSYCSYPGHIAHASGSELRRPKSWDFKPNPGCIVRCSLACATLWDKVSKTKLLFLK